MIILLKYVVGLFHQTPFPFDPKTKERYLLSLAFANSLKISGNDVWQMIYIHHFKQDKDW